MRIDGWEALQRAALIGANLSPITTDQHRQPVRARNYPPPIEVAPASDLDLYVYIQTDLPLADRQRIATAHASDAEVD
jgi:hypothetical protein